MHHKISINLCAFIGAFCPTAAQGVQPDVTIVVDFKYYSRSEALAGNRRDPRRGDHPTRHFPGLPQKARSLGHSIAPSHRIQGRRAR